MSLIYSKKPSSSTFPPQIMQSKLTLAIKWNYMLKNSFRNDKLIIVIIYDYKKFRNIQQN